MTVQPGQALVLCALVVACHSAAPAPTPDRAGAVPPSSVPDARTRHPKPHAVKTVFLIVFENHNWSSIKGSRSAPYLNEQVLPIASFSETYFNPPGDHPSETNYLWLEAGTHFGRATDAEPARNRIASRAHLTALLDAAGLSWRSYQEDISGTTCPLHATREYVPRHQAFVYFDDVTDGGDERSVTCIAHVRPYDELARDLEQGTVARYNFITPNLCHDMHDSCAPEFDRVRQADSWLARELPRILASRAYRDGGAIFITWDEAEVGDGPIGMILLSPVGKGHGYESRVRTSHSSTLRTLEEIFGVEPMLGDAANAPDLSDLFETFP